MNTRLTAVPGALVERGVCGAGVTPSAALDAAQRRRRDSGARGRRRHNPSMPSPYSIRLSIPANTRIQAHTHRDNRSAVVVAGVWYFGYGRVADAAEEKALPAGSFCTEPGAHCAETNADPALVYITGNGPTDTRYVQDTADSAHR